MSSKMKVRNYKLNMVDGDKIKKFEKNYNRTKAVYNEFINKVNKDEHSKEELHKLVLGGLDTDFKVEIDSESIYYDLSMEDTNCSIFAFLPLKIYLDEKDISKGEQLTLYINNGKDVGLDLVLM